jgi:hypothetical protein
MVFDAASTAFFMMDRLYSLMIATNRVEFITCAVKFIQKSMTPDSINQVKNRRVKLKEPPFPGMKPEGRSSKPRAEKRTGMKEMCFAHEGILRSRLRRADWKGAPWFFTDGMIGRLRSSLPPITIARNAIFL